MTVVGMQICADILGIIIMLFIIYLLKNNELLNQIKTVDFIHTAVMVIVVILLEIITVYCQHYPANTPRMLHVLANAAGFSLSPLVPLFMAALYSDSIMKQKKIIVLPMLLNIAVAISSIWTGWLFHVSKDNSYERGPLFLLNAVTAAYGFVILIYVNHKNSKILGKTEKTYLKFLYLIVIFGVAIQLISPRMLLIWPCVAVSLLMYYIFLRESEFKYDVLTGVQNRRCFEEKLCEMQHWSQATIIMLDLNNLKYINDTYGHGSGDRRIREAAEIVRMTVGKLGIPYRIGGDEFCVLCNIIDEEKTRQCIEHLDKTVEKYKNQEESELSIAYGYAYYRKNIEENTKELCGSVAECLANADNYMYQRKEKMKKNKNGVA